MVWALIWSELWPVRKLRSWPTLLCQVRTSDGPLHIQYSRSVVVLQVSVDCVTASANIGAQNIRSILWQRAHFRKAWMTSNLHHLASNPEPSPCHFCCECVSLKEGLCFIQSQKLFVLLSLEQSKKTRVKVHENRRHRLAKHTPGPINR